MDAESWRARFDTAAAYLDDTGRLAGDVRVVAELARADGQRAHALAGEAGLRGAARVGLFAGSFNPLTRAHVELVGWARVAGALDVVAWSEAVVTVDKERVTRATLVDRLAQLRAFADGAARESGAAVVLMNRGLYVDQAGALRTLLAPGADLCIITGFDKLAQIFDPRYYHDRDAALRLLFENARLLVGPRGRDRRAAVDALLARPENRPFARFVTYFDVPGAFANDSATRARALAKSLPARSEDLRALVTPEGYALAQTGAYAAESTPEANAYTWRARWEAILPRLSPDAPAERADLPPMGALVRMCQEDSPAGASVRGLLARAADGEDPTKLRNALAHLARSEGDSPR